MKNTSLMNDEAKAFVTQLKKDKKYKCAEYYRYAGELYTHIGQYTTDELKKMSGGLCQNHYKSYDGRTVDCKRCILNPYHFLRRGGVADDACCIWTEDTILYIIWRRGINGRIDKRVK